MPQSTLRKFGYPEQPTLGTMVLVCKESVHRYSGISPEAAAEQKQIIDDIENVMKHCFDCNKLNYLMLMMVDPAVHYHVIPRYEFSVEFCNQEFIDNQWPNPPSLIDELNLDICEKQNLLNILKSDFNCN
ncbi:hypothetical protein AB4140_13400 [Shewanella sp. 10N.286.51.B2]|uniref:hypothetical protein n=1 Tax=unclassified Shewanella TaxID=196818 RepID=UPI0026E221C3|nr:hypothetical protein [Shewanella sp. 3_MG-2023]MDO6775168.1 hypothetical protein [Shewanella sp. 3_MG-2023]